MIFASRPRRAARAHEWNRGKVVTFIVTLAATRCVTLAAREAGMSRKSARALKSRDPEFADCWKRAIATVSLMGGHLRPRVEARLLRPSERVRRSFRARAQAPAALSVFRRNLAGCNPHCCRYPFGVLRGRDGWQA